MRYERYGCSRAIDVVLHRGRPAYSDRPDNFYVQLNGEPSTPCRHTGKRGNAGQERRIALDKVEKILRGDAEQSCVRFILRHLDGRDRGPIHPAKGLEIAAIIENGYVLAYAKFSGFRQCCIHHFLCYLNIDALFLHHVSHWIPSSSHLGCSETFEILLFMIWSSSIHLPLPELKEATPIAVHRTDNRSSRAPLSWTTCCDRMDSEPSRAG